MAHTFKNLFAEFKGVEPQSMFRASLPEVSPHFDDSLMMWDGQALGLQSGFFARSNSGKVFVVRTSVMLEGLEDDVDFEWHVDCHSLAVANEVMKELRITEEKVVWRAKGS